MKPEAIHVVNLDNHNETSDDYVDVRALSGPMLINGGNGWDVVNVSSAEQRKVDNIRALLMFDGGDDEDTDTLFLDNSGDTDRNDIFNVTRGLVEMESMVARDEAFGSDTNPFLPRQSYLVGSVLLAFLLISVFQYLIFETVSKRHLFISKCVLVRLYSEILLGAHSASL